MPDTPTIHIDGAARGNPGPAAYAFVLRQPGVVDTEIAATMGKATNNVAEYTALIKALEYAQSLGLKSVHIFSDSELLVKQMNGQYRVKNADLKSLYDLADRLRKQFQNVELTHVRRADNPDADRLCNLALDGKLGLSGQSIVSEAEGPRGDCPSTRSRGRGSDCATQRIREIMGQERHRLPPRGRRFGNSSGKFYNDMASPLRNPNHDSLR